MAQTYTTLTQDLQDYCETDETTFVAKIPTFIKQAEDRILNAAQLSEFRKSSTASTTNGNTYLAQPTDYLAPYSMAVNNSGLQYLLLKDVSYIREMYPDPAVTGIPKVYGIFSEDTFILGPTPNGSLTVQLHYFFRPASIVDSETSWLGTNAESCLLYGALVEAYTFLKGDADIMTMYLTRYKEALADLKDLGEGHAQTDDYRDGALRAQRQ